MDKKTLQNLNILYIDYYLDSILKDMELNSLPKEKKEVIKLQIFEKLENRIRQELFSMVIDDDASLSQLNSELEKIDENNFQKRIEKFLEISGKNEKAEGVIAKTMLEFKEEVTK